MYLILLKFNLRSFDLIFKTNIIFIFFEFIMYNYFDWSIIIIKK
jgi:hypothetical protein